MLHTRMQEWRNDDALLLLLSVVDPAESPQVGPTSLNSGIRISGLGSQVRKELGSTNAGSLRCDI